MVYLIVGSGDCAGLGLVRFDRIIRKGILNCMDFFVVGDPCSSFMNDNSDGVSVDGVSLSERMGIPVDFVDDCTGVSLRTIS